MLLAALLLLLLGVFCTAEDDDLKRFSWLGRNRCVSADLKNLDGYRYIRRQTPEVTLRECARHCGGTGWKGCLGFSFLFRLRVRPGWVCRLHGNPESIDYDNPLFARVNTTDVDSKAVPQKAPNDRENASCYVLGPEQGQQCLGPQGRMCALPFRLDAAFYGSCTLGKYLKSDGLEDNTSYCRSEADKGPMIPCSCSGDGSESTVIHPDDNGKMVIDGALGVSVLSLVFVLLLVLVGFIVLRLRRRNERAVPKAQQGSPSTDLQGDVEESLLPNRSPEDLPSSSTRTTEHRPLTIKTNSRSAATETWPAMWTDSQTQLPQQYQPPVDSDLRPKTKETSAGESSGSVNGPSSYPVMWTDSLMTPAPVLPKHHSDSTSSPVSPGAFVRIKPSSPTPPGSSQLSGNSRGSSSRTELRNLKQSDLVGLGAFGSVFRALGDTGELLAVKKIPLLPGMDIEGAKKEYTIMSRLEHPNVVEVRDFIPDVDHDTVGIVMEFVAGGSIAGLLRDFGALQQKTISNYVQQILSGLSHLHEHKIIHSDIKPSNILVHPNGSIKLTDFGLSRFAMQTTKQPFQPVVEHNHSRDTPLSLASVSTIRSLMRANPLQSQSTCTIGTGTLDGTIPYMSPNVVRRLLYTPQSDIWAVGCTVKEMATGIAPWLDKYKLPGNEEHILVHIGEGRHPPFPLSPEYPNQAPLRLFVARCYAAEETGSSCGDLLVDPFVKG